MNLLATLFVHAHRLGIMPLWFAIPVGLAVAIVYKTLRTNDLRRLPREIALLSAYILAGMAGLVLALGLLVRYVIR